MSTVYSIYSDRTKYIHRYYKRLEIKNKPYGFKNRTSKSKWKKIQFPANVNLIEEPDNILIFFNLAYDYYSKKFNIEYDLSEILRFSPESIAVLAACIASEHFTKGMQSRGNFPSNAFLSTMFKDSGFFDHVTILGKRINTRKNPTAELLHKVTNAKVETDIAKSTCIYIKKILNINFVDDLEPVYDILIEAMQNTNNHAAAGTEKEYDWWLYRYEEKGKKIVHFTFLDIGVGVFNSLPVMNWRRKLLETVKFTSNMDLVDDLLTGKIKSRTLKKDRGKGIPQIYSSSKDEIFKDFYILTNDIMINAKTDVRIKLKQEFQGTLYYWTIQY